MMPRPGRREKRSAAAAASSATAQTPEDKAARTLQRLRALAEGPLPPSRLAALNSLLRGAHLQAHAGSCCVLAWELGTLDMCSCRHAFKGVQ
jgi:hypothetical protein